MSCNAEVNRASTFAIVSEDTCGVLKVISSATSFIPLRSGFTFDSSFEELANEELNNSIGMTKSFKGKETHSGSHAAYLKNNEDDGFPEIDPILLNAFGTKVSRASTYSVMASTLTSIAVNDDANSVMEVGECILVSDTTNGYFARNIVSISSDGSIVRFFPSLDTAPGLGSVINKNYMYKPDTTELNTFSSWLHRADGGTTEAMAGCAVTDLTLELPASQQANLNVSYQGSEYYFNPINITSDNSKLQFMAASDTHTVDIPPKVYRTPQDLGDSIKISMDRASADTHTVIYKSFGTNKGKFNISSDGTQLTLLWSTGSFANNSIGTQVGFDTSANDSGSTNYNSDNVQIYNPRVLSSQATLSPSYDDADNIVLKDATCYLGTLTDNFLRKASTVSVSIGTPLSDIDDMTSESGLYARIKNSRETTVTATFLFEKHESNLFYNYLNNDTVSFATTIGPKDIDGNFVPTKCVNIYAPTAIISEHKISGDEILAIEVTVKGHVTSDNQDVYLNYC